MIQKSASTNPGHVRVTFELPASVWADHIFLTGDFNDWKPHESPLRQERDGVWRITLDLPAGQFYEFRYVIDGQWQTDYHADGFSSNQYGSYNSIVNASLPIAQVPQKPLHRYTQEQAANGVHEQRSRHVSRLPRLRPRTPARSVA